MKKTEDKRSDAQLCEICLKPEADTTAEDADTGDLYSVHTSCVGATLTITGLPNLEAEGGYIDSLVSSVLENVDADWSEESARERVRMGAKAMLYAAAVASQSDGRVNAELMVAFIAAAIADS